MNKQHGRQLLFCRDCVYSFLRFPWQLSQTEQLQTTEYSFTVYRLEVQTQGSRKALLCMKFLERTPALPLLGSCGSCHPGGSSACGCSTALPHHHHVTSSPCVHFRISSSQKNTMRRGEGGGLKPMQLYHKNVNTERPSLIRINTHSIPG